MKRKLAIAIAIAALFLPAYMVFCYELGHHIAFSSPNDLPVGTSLFSDKQLALYGEDKVIYLLGSDGKVWAKVSSTNKLWSVGSAEIRVNKKPVVTETNGEYVIRF